MKLKKSVWIPFFAVVMWMVVGSIIVCPAFGETFSIVVMPDTQNYSESRPETFAAQTQWIAANRDALNIIYVAHVGDIVNAYNDNNYTLFSSCGMDFIAVNLNFADTVGPGQTAVIGWADGLLKTYSDRRAIITSHYFLDYTDVSPQDGKPDFGAYGQAIFDGLKDNPNLFMMLCGRGHGEGTRIEANDAGGPVYILLSDYQDKDGGNSGYLRIMRFDAATDQITVSTYSPTLNAYGADAILGANTAAADFTLGYDMDPCPGAVLLFDTSGSMSRDVNNNMDVPEEQQRLTLAKHAAEAFVQLLDEYNGKGGIGIAAFPRHPFDGCNAEALKGLTSAPDDTGETDIFNGINGLSAGGSTPMPAGLETASAMFSSGDTKAVVLLSDGYHNCPTAVEAGSAEFETMVGNLDDVVVHAIGFSSPGDIDGHFLDELAGRTSGTFSDVTDVDSGLFSFDPDHPEDWTTETAQVELTGAYANILTEILGLDKIAGLLDVIGKGETNTHEIAINGYDQKVAVLLSWHTPDEEQLELELRSSDDQAVDLKDKGVTCRNGSTYKIVFIEGSFLRLPGKVGNTPWKMEVAGKGVGRHKAEQYQYTVITKSTLNLDASFDKRQYKTGNTVTISARLTLAGRPVLNRENISVLVTRPIDGAGNWFAQNKISAEQLETVPALVGEETLSDIQRKALYLEDALDMKFPGKADPVKLRLYDNGTNGDAVAGDGVYTNQFFDTVKEGTYSFYFQAKGIIGDNKIFSREKLIQKYITVNASPENLMLEAKNVGYGDDGEQYKITITPKDVFGNFLGPRYSKAIKITPSKWTIMGPLTDNLDGTYTRIIEIPEEVSYKDVDITVSINGMEITKPFPPLQEQPKGRNHFLWTIIILFIITCIIVSFVNKARKKVGAGSGFRP